MGNDAPLAALRTKGMPFVSVAANHDQLPLDLRAWHIGGLEHGTAAVLRALVRAIEAGADVPLDDIVRAVAKEMAGADRSNSSSLVAEGAEHNQEYHSHSSKIA
jgi:hypothetical protein